MRTNSILTILAASIAISTATLTKGDIAHIVEGVLSGIIQDEHFSGLEDCIQEVEVVDEDFKNAVNDFEKETFEGIKEGLALVGQAVRLIPTVVSECKAAETDLTKMIQLAEIFEHPLQLVYRVGKNLILNGIEIFKEINKAVNSYQAGKYYDFGYALGTAMDEVFLKSIAQNRALKPKRMIDSAAFSFLAGFLSEAEISLQHEELYNSIDKRGIQFYGPIKNVMNLLERSNGAIDLKIWLAVHEVAHVF